MFRVLVFVITVSIVMTGCGENVDFITQDIVDNVTDCYNSTGITSDEYIISFGKECIDSQLTGVNPQPLTSTDPGTIVDIPSDWKLIATLQPNPRDIDEFLIDDVYNEKSAMINAYLAGKWFIFEIGKEEMNRKVNRERHLIIQTGIPFQDSDLDQEKPDGTIQRKERYPFTSEPTWYTNSGSELTYATGFVVEFHYEKQKNRVTGGLQDLSEVNIGLNKSGRNYIHEWVRLRVYVSE